MLRSNPTSKRRRALLLAIAWLVAPPGAGALAEDPASARALGLRLAGEGRCEAALPLLDTARAGDPQDAELALRAGECRVRLQRYAEAERDLAGATRLAPERGEGWLALAKARYHARDAAGAGSALEQAERLLPDHAEVAFYRGVLWLDAGDPERAIAALERALRLDPERVEPVASLQLARARALDRDRAGARADLERVVDAWEGTDWSTRAGRDLARLRAGPPRNAWLSLGAAVEHDTNVVLRGRGVPRPAEVGDDHDQRGVWSGNGGLELWKSEQVAFGMMGSYRGTTHADLTRFDAHFPSATAWLDWAMAEDLVASARYDFGYAWLDGDPFLASNSWQVALARASREWGRSQAYARVYTDDYFFESDDVPDSPGPTCPVGVTVCSPVGVDERSERRRSGWGLTAGIGQRIPLPSGPLPLRDPSLRGGFDFDYFEARGREYSHTESRVGLGVAAGLPLALELDVSGAYTYRPFRHPSTFPDPPLAPGVPYALSGVRRREHAFELEALLSRPIGDAISVEAYWSFVDNQSNTDVFDFERQVFGLGVNLYLGREL